MVESESTATPEKVPKKPVARWEIIALVLIVCAVLLTRVSTLDNKLLEAHPLRQTQTAFQTVGFHDNGIDVLHPTVPVLGSPWELPLEFPAFQVAASVLMSWGMPADMANRTTALFFFIVTALLLWILVRWISNPAIALIALVAFAFSPFSLLWSRASLIEYLATAAAIGWVLCVFKVRDTPHWAIAAGGIALGALAMTVKITTAIAWLPLMLLYEPNGERSPVWAWRQWIRERVRPGFALTITVPFLAANLWASHTDSINAASAGTSWAQSYITLDRALGSLSERVDPSLLPLILNRIENYLIGHGTLFLLIAVVFVQRFHRRSWFGILAVPALAIGTFIGLYLEHDYYLAAVSPALAALVGLGIWSLVSWTGLSGRSVSVALAAVTVVWLGFALFWSQAYWQVAYAAPRDPPPASTEIAAVTAPDELVFVGGLSWDPRILYYAQRRGLMLYEGHLTPDFVAQQPDLDNYTTAYFPSPIHHQVDWIVARPWYSPRSDHILKLGSTAADLHNAELLATTEVFPDLFDVDPSDSRVVIDRSEISCDGEDQILIPAGPEEVWLSILSEETGRPIMRTGFIATPARTRTLIWRPKHGETERVPETLTCINGGILHIKAGLAITPFP